VSSCCRDRHRRDAHPARLAARALRRRRAYAGGAGTRLLFGSAVMPRHDADGNPSLGAAYALLLGLHKAYSRALLASACARLRRR
jgi:hypothetical protein